MIITLVTDAWEPQVNGVVRTWGHVKEECEKRGHTFHVLHPGQFKTITAPRYPEIQLALNPKPKVRAMLDEQRPDAIHIATEGPLGQAARKYCKKRGHAWTTSYHTQFPQYLKRYFKVPQAATYRFIRWFHGPAKACLVPTRAVSEELKAKGLSNTVVWSRGVDAGKFYPEPRLDYEAEHGLRRPVFLYAGRVAVEKNIEAFLALDLPGSKVVVGDGPAKAKLERQYPGVHWAGYQFGDDLSRHYAGGDVFVFPSRTDTFGVVMLEANACGLPVAAYPVTGPIDVVEAGVNGVLDDDLGKAAVAALRLDRQTCIHHAHAHTWAKCAQTVLDHLAPIAR